MQTLGDTTQAWTLTAFASRLVVALGYHSVDARMLEECDRNHEIRRCIRWCYYYDKVLSMLLVRPPSLPALSVEPASLLLPRQADPLDMKGNILIKLAHVLDGALSVLTPGDGIPDNQALGAITRLEVELQDIWEELCEFTALCDQLYETIAQDASQQYQQTTGTIGSQPTAVTDSNAVNVAVYPQPHESLTARAHSSDSTQLGTSEKPVLYSHALDPGSSAEGLSQQTSSMWDDGLMWELFNIQPTVEWFDAGYKDSATGL
ncbi:unnamed protein product [Aspergillus oryzae var. brunneus]|uniref:Unnamed protein product n=2 Tax=Aspergillus oryzae TaxID=5062 RepID=A0AAN4YPQ1_ASPOZ|nr:unnamed protein product [Aspergillus oryzae]GMG33737.1 unnamed protein product [Aspergillus oryzae]GMG53058.1 unnamed protein product [Aspergillus oryzae var. brunneus]